MKTKKSWFCVINKDGTGAYIRAHDAREAIQKYDATHATNYNINWTAAIKVY